MPWESDEKPGKPGWDWAKAMWIGVAILMALGVAAMFLPGRTGAEMTEARVKQIVVKFDNNTPEKVTAAYNTISSLRERILNGENFGKLAREYSGDESSAARGGDLGWVRRGDQTETVDDYIWIAPLGEVSGVLVSPYGLHLLLVTERHFSDAEEYEKQLKERVLDSLQQTPETATP